jgi:hypothetical protein
MKRTGWIRAAVSFVLIQGAPAWAEPLEVLVEPGRVAVQAHGVPLGRILETLAERGGMYVLIDERRAAQPLTVRLEAGEIQEAIVGLMREAGGGNYAIVRTDPRGTLETLLFQDAVKGAAAAAQASEPAYGTPAYPPTSPTYPVGGGGAYAGAVADAPYRDAATPYGDAPTRYAGGPKSYPVAGSAAAAAALRGLDQSLLTDYEQEEKIREELEGRRGTKELN